MFSRARNVFSRPARARWYQQARSGVKTQTFKRICIVAAIVTLNKSRDTIVDILSPEFKRKVSEKRDSIIEALVGTMTTMIDKPGEQQELDDEARQYLLFWSPAALGF